MELDLDKTATIDILNISHDDVLQLYRGWRRSESQLKDKNKELTTLRKRIEQLQEAHVKFSGQIQALKSVKELTVNLQTQLSALQQENLQLNSENTELKTHVSTMESHVSETVEKSHSTVRETQIDQAILRGRCQELVNATKHQEIKLEDEQAQRLATEKRLETAEALCEDLRQENGQLKQELADMTARVNQCDSELAIASNQLSTLSKEVGCISQTQERLVSSEAEVGVLKGDISRLIHLLEHNKGANGFVSHWKDSGSAGMTFVGLNRKKDKNTAKKAAFGVDDEDDENFNSENFGDGGMEEDEDMISPTEYAHLQRMYGGDPFPMTSSFSEEAEHWAPNDLVFQGLKFVETNMPHISKSVIMEFIATMNKIWMRREKRKILRVKERYEKILGEMQRQRENSKPYREVIAEAAMKRLQSQVKEKRSKNLRGRPKKFHELSREERNYFDVEDEFGDLDADGAAMGLIPSNERKPCMLPQKGTRSHIKALSANKLLVASLESLETIGKQSLATSVNRNQSMRRSVPGSSPRRSGFSPRRYGGRNSPSAYNSTDDDGDRQPSEEYLRGALWLGRNFVSVVEELCSNVESVRLRCLKDIAQASADGDTARTAHRLALLVNSIVTEYTTMVLKVSYKGREMLQVWGL